MSRNAHGSPPSTSGGGELRAPGNGDQNQAPWTPSRTAASEIRRPMPQNKAIETNWLASDFSETSGLESDLETGDETRIAVGMSGSPKHVSSKIPAR
jgi:hypothetical protein